MRVENGTLILEDNDCEHIQDQIDIGLEPDEALEAELFMCGIDKKIFGDLQVNMNYLELCCKITTAYWNKR